MVRTTAELSEAIDEALRYIKRHIKVTTAVLFGSYAQGTAGPYSDIDLAVFSPDVADWGMEQRIDLGVEVKLRFPDVELHLFPDEALKKARPSNFYGHLLSTGKRVA